VKDGSNTRVVVLFPGALGDLVLARPALLVLRARHAGAHVVLAVHGWLRALAATGDMADEVASLDDADAAGLFGGARLPKWFGDRPELYAWIGTRDPDVAERLRSLAARAALFAVVRDDAPTHASLDYLRQIDAAPDAGPVVPWPAPASTARVEAVGAGRPLLVVHPGAGAIGKRWPAAGFRVLVDRWQRAGGVAAEILGPADADVAPLGAVDRIVEWPLPDIAALLARSDAYAGNDSGISHLAGAVGARGVAVFGPTRSRRWGPGGRIAAIDTEGAFPRDDEAARRLAARVWSTLSGAGCLDKVQGRT